MATTRHGDPRGDRLLDIARDHVRRFGIERTTVVSIAREAGMTHANVYRYFPSKEALVDAVTAAWLKEVETSLTAVADAPDPADDKLERLLLAYARALRERCEQEPNLMALYVAALADGRVVVRRHRQRVRGLIERTIEEGIAADIFRIRNRERAVILVHDMAYRFLDPVAVVADRDLARPQADLRVAAIVRLVIRALAAGVP